MSRDNGIVWDAIKEVAEIEVYLGRRVKISVASKDGLKWMLLRMFRQDAKTKVWKPTREGVNLPFLYVQPTENYETMGLFVEAFAAAIEEGNALPLYDPETMLRKEDTFRYANNRNDLREE